MSNTPAPSSTSANSARPYVGRFAPSPTGPLHFGSLISALASFLDARAQQGLWLVRIEDIDPPREQAGASTDILNCLEAHGLLWDGPVLYQSQRHDLYREAAQNLVAQHRAFYCTCSRAQLMGQSVYPGLCRAHFVAPVKPHAIRVRVPAEVITFDDAVQGSYSEVLERAVGDFVIFRKEQLPAYQLAVVIDDAAQNVTHVVRGCDLLHNTARQIFLQQCLQLATPQYAHIPVIANPRGQKLSKQTYAPALTAATALENLCAALDFLGQSVPDYRAYRDPESLLGAAIEHWSLARIPRVRQLPDGQRPDAQLPPSCRHFTH